MAEETKKPKIDLRARLGKKNAPGGGASMPPPASSPLGSIPPARASIPVPGASIPSPAMGIPPSAISNPAPLPSRPAPGASIPSPAANFPAPGASIPSPPFAAPAAATPSQAPARPKFVEPQSIKIELGDDVLLAQKKSKSKLMMMLAGVAVVGAVIGVAIGGGMERRGRQDIALEGAKILAGEIDTANVEIAKLVEILGKAKRGLSDGEYPAKEVAALAEVAIPFDGTYLAGKGTGLMSAKINMSLVNFAGQSTAANDQKDRLHRVLTGSETALKELLSQKEKPKFNWSVFVVPGPHGPMAAMQPLPEPFLVSSKEKTKDKKTGKEEAYSWPKEIEVKERGKKVKLKMYDDGNPVSRTPLLIPVEPGSQSLVCPNDTMVRLRGEIVKLEKLLRGDKSDPTNEKKGLSDLGKNLIDQLKGIGGAG